MSSLWRTSTLSSGLNFDTGSAIAIQLLQVEIAVREVVERIATRYDVTEEQVETARETISFKLPRGLEHA